MNDFWENFGPRQKVMAFLGRLHVFGNPSAKLKIVGVTGTNGKTTTTTLLYRVAMALGHNAGLIGTVENVIAGVVEPTSYTTPDVWALQKLLSKMVNAKC